MPSIKFSKETIDNSSLTKHQFETLKFIFWFFMKYGYSPSMVEIADKFSIARSAAFERIERLRRKGYLKRGNKNKERRCELSDTWDKRKELKRFFAQKVI